MNMHIDKYLYCNDCGKHMFKFTTFRNCKKCCNLVKKGTIFEKCQRCKLPKEPDINGMCENCRKIIAEDNKIAWSSKHS